MLCGMEAKIQKWGNSLGLRIPAAIAKDLSLKHGYRSRLIERVSEETLTAVQEKLLVLLE